MAWTEKRLGQVKITSGKTVTLYTCPAATIGICKVIWITNVLTTDGTINIYHVPSGSSPTASNQLTNTWKVLWNNFAHIDTFVVLSASDTIQLTSPVSSSSNFTVSLYGAEI